MTVPKRLFLLSPASTFGKRAALLARPESSSPCAVALHGPAGVPIAEAFSYVSSLYFRGKIAYARRFAAEGPDEAGGDGILVIAPGFGLVPPSWPLTRERFELMRRTRVDAEDAGYVEPMRRHGAALAERLPADAEVVLLGSIATGKYLDLLIPAFGDRLRFPRMFVSAGEMRRGALLLQAAREGEELEYAGLDVPRSGRREIRKGS